MYINNPKLMDDYMFDSDEDEKSLFYEDMDKYKTMTFKISAIKCILGKDKTSLKDCYHRDKDDKE